MLELDQTLQRIDRAVDIDTAVVQIEGIGFRRKLRYIAERLHSNRPGTDEQYLQVWPATGLLEPWLHLRRSNCSAIVIHDPIALRHQYGFGRLSRFGARVFRSRKISILSHTRDATVSLQDLFPRCQIVEAMHPILSAQSFSRKSEGIILVADQWKPSRDLDLLSHLGPSLKRHGFRPRIVGRGWPSIEGWEVRSEFVSEFVLTQEIDQATAVIIPYQKYFQSGIESPRCVRRLDSLVKG